MNNEQRIEQVFYGVDFFRKKKCCRQAKSSKVFLQKKLSAGWLNLRNREEEFVPFFQKIPDLISQIFPQGQKILGYQPRPFCINYFLSFSYFSTNHKDHTLDFRFSFSLFYI